MNNPRIKVPLLTALILLCASPSRSNPEDFTVWKGVVSHIAETQVSWQTLEDYDDHLIAVSYLQGGGPAELHQSQSEILIVQSGEGTLVVGGAILKADVVKPLEIQGTSMSGGSETPLRQGDIVHISANVPHQLRAGTGKRLIYTTIRIGSR
jgi:mannose-6-phosphate isomerase-like protein (cupin superfamily)